MKIISLTASNVKRLRAVEISPEGDVITITGQNGAGKSSVLDAIMYALCGKDVHPPEVIRRGESKAHVTVDLGDLVVERRWTANDRSTVTVKSKDGAKYSSPQSLLDSLVGRLSFDPLTFTRMDPKKQVEVVRELAGLDFTELDQRRAAVYEQRTEVNRELTRLKSRVTSLEQTVTDADAEPVSLSELMAEQEQALAQKAENDRVRAEYSKATDRWTRAKEAQSAAEKRVAELEAQLAMARNMVQSATHDLAAAVEAGKSARAAVDALVDPDLVSIREKVQNAETINEQARKAAELRKLREELAQVEARTEQLSEQLENLDAEKGITLEKATFPIAGLGFNEVGVTFNGLPLEQASAAEQLRISIAIGLALNPKLRVLLIRDASLLDRKSLQVVQDMAAKADAQVWLERVAGEGETGILIEDGAIAGADESRAAVH